MNVIMADSAIFKMHRQDGGLKGDNKIEDEVSAG